MQIYYVILILRGKYAPVGIARFMSRPIILWDASRRRTANIDDGGVNVIGTLLAPMPPPGPDDYDDKRTYSPFYYVPPLQFMCIARLVQHPQGIEAIHTLQLAYQSGSKQKFDILRAFIPTYDPEDPLRQLSLSSVDPRLWAVLIQVYSHLPDSIRTYRIPFSDKHVPLLQRIPSTPNFTLLTILELPDCPELTDNTVQELRYLDGLTALDASRTMLSADAVRILLSTCNWGDDEAKRGPWGLRILCLRECRYVDDRVFKYISGFRLLSIAGSFVSLSCVTLRSV
jgi:hypothetical protein